MSSVKRSPESGVCLKRVPLKRVLYLFVVGVSNETAAACEAACELADVAFLRFATGIAACPAIQAAAPTVVVITSALFTDEKLVVTETARLVGARVIELPELTSATARAEIAVRAVLRQAMEERDGASSKIYFANIA